MADEFSIAIRLQVTKGYFSDNINKSFSDDMNIATLGGGIQLIGTTAETIAFGDVAYAGWLYLENVDAVAANIIDYGPYDSGSGKWLADFKLAPGEGALLKLRPGAVLRAASRSTPARLLVKCYDSTSGT